MIDDDTYKIGMFKNNLLHGQGKRINPNQIIQSGYFQAGYLIQGQKDEFEKTNVYVPKKVNWNQYLTGDHHINVMKLAISQEN